MEAAVAILLRVIFIYKWVLILRAILSWFMPEDNPLMVLLYKVTEPYVATVRDFLPRSLREQPIDLGFLLAFVLLILLESALAF